MRQIMLGYNSTSSTLQLIKYILLLYLPRKKGIAEHFLLCQYTSTSYKTRKTNSGFSSFIRSVYKCVAMTKMFNYALQSVLGLELFE